MNNWLDKYDEGIIPSAQEGTSIFDEGARVAREEYLRQQYRDYLRGEAQKGREAVRRGSDEAAKDILPWMAVPFAGAAASALTVIPLITAPSATIAGMVGGTAGMHLTDRAVRRYSDDNYGTWGEMMAGETGIPPILGEFTNPGALIGGMMGSSVPGVIRKIPGQYSNLVTAAQKGQLYKINPFARKADPTKVYTTMTENRARYILDKNAPITRYSTPGKRDVYHPVFDDKGNITHYVVQSDMERFLQTGGANTPIGVYFMNKMRTIPSTIGEQLRRPKYKNTKYGLPDKTSYGYSYRRTLNEIIEEAIKQRGAYSSISPDVKFRFGAIPNYGKPKGAQIIRRVTRHRMPAPAKFEPNPIIMEGDPTKISFVGAPSKAERLQYIPRDIGNFPIGKTAIPEESIIGNELSYGPGLRMMRQDPVWGLSPLREGEMDLLRTTSVLPERESRITNAILGFDKALNKAKSFKLSSVNVNMPPTPRELIDRMAGTYRGYVTPIQQKVLAGDRWSAEDDLVFRKLSSLRKLTSELEGYSPNKKAGLFKLIESSPLSNEELQHFINQYISGVGTFTSKVSLAQDIAQQRSPVKGIKDVQVFADVSNQPNQTLIDLSKRSDVFKQYFEKQYQKRIDKILEANAVPMLPPGSDYPEGVIGAMFRRHTANIHSELEQAIAQIKASPGGKTFIGSGSLSAESYPLTVYKGSSIFGNDPGYGIFRGEYMPLNTYDDFRRLGVNPEYIATYLNNYLRRVNVGGKRFPAARVHYDPNSAPNVEVPTFYLKKYKGGGIIPSAQGGKSVIFAESPTLEIASAQDGLSAKLAPIKQKVREKLYRTVPPSDYPIRQLPSVVKNLITGRERMNSLDEINQLLEEREQLSPIIKQYEKDFSRAWDSSYGEGRHEAISKVTDKYGRELDELSRIEMRLDEISGGYDVVDEDLWRKYLEMPQLQGSVRPSRYKPAKAKDPSAEYFTIPDIVEDGTRNWKADVFKFAVEHDKGNGEFPTYDVPGPPGLARIKVDKGKDKKGEYYSIYDIYDFNIPGERLIGKPFEIYDRIYLDKDKKGNYTPRYQKGGEVSKYTPEYIEQLKQFENKPSNLGYHLDPKKIPTIGWGHRLTAEELKKKAVRVGKEWIPYEKFSGKEGRTYADRLMEYDVQHHYGRLESQVGKDTLETLPPEVVDVLLDITYNRGSLGDSAEYVKKGDVVGLKNYLASVATELKGGAKKRMEWRANRIPTHTLPPVEAPLYTGEQRVPEVLDSFTQTSTQVPYAPIIEDNAGYLNPSNYGSPVRIGSNDITMEGVPFPVLGISDEGEVRIMMPGEDHRFKGSTVTEFPLAQNTDNLSNFTKPKGWLDKYE